VETSSAPAAAMVVVAAEAAAWAVLTTEPIVATSDAAAASASGATVTNDIETPPTSPKTHPNDEQTKTTPPRAQKNFFCTRVRDASVADAAQIRFQPTEPATSAPSGTHGNGRRAARVAGRASTNATASRFTCTATRCSAASSETETGVAAGTTIPATC